MQLDFTEQAFAENLILAAGVPGPRLRYPLLAREAQGRPLWDVCADLGLAPEPVLRQAYEIAAQTVQALNPQAFSFSEGALVGSWELTALRGRDLGGEVWTGQLGGSTGTIRVIPPGSGHDGERTQRFVERSNAGLDPPHPSILKVDEAQEDFGWLYTATAGVDAAPIGCLRARGPLPEPSVIALGQSVVKALQVVHGLGVVHGALTPLGVLFREQQTFVTDFGLCAALLDGPVHGCSPGGRLGVLLHAAPDVIRGDAAGGLDSRDDLYALGSVLYALLAAVGLGDTRAAADAPWLFEPPVSPGLRAVLARLLAPAREARYPTAAALAADLDRLAAGGQPAPLVGPGGHVIGRRSATAAPQAVLRPEALREVLAAAPAPALVPAPAPPPVEPLPVAEPQPAPQPQVSAPAARLRSSERLRAAPARRESRGWLAALGALVAVGGGLAGAHVATQPAGVQAGRAAAAAAAATLQEEQPRYGEALARLDAALPALVGDTARARAALALRDELEAAAAAERAALLGRAAAPPPKLDPAALGALDELAARCQGLRLAVLLRSDAAHAAGGALLDWNALGDALLGAGFPAAAAAAFEQLSNAPAARAARALADEFVFLPGGPYLVAGEDGALRLEERAPCYLGRTEVTRAQYARFLAEAGAREDPHATCDPSEGQGADHTPARWPPRPQDAELPVTGVDYHDARAYCRAEPGVDLADAASLAAAAAGRGGLRFPWGDAPPAPPLANVGGLLDGLTPAGALPAGAGAGAPALDLVGNVAEWCRGEGEQAPVFGGDAATPPDAVTAGVAAARLDKTARPDAVGFRPLYRPR